MRAFRRTRRGYTANLDATERQIIARTVADVAQLLGYPVSGPPPGGFVVVDPAVTGLGPETFVETYDDDTVPPTDPALMRLLPPASEDADVAAQLRGLSEASIRTAKARRLHAVHEALMGPAGRSDRLDIDPAAAMDWAGALTDVRLVLAERLGIEDDEDARRLDRLALTSPDEVTRALATLYLALSWLQESLLSVMLSDLPDTSAP